MEERGIQRWFPGGEALEIGEVPRDGRRQEEGNWVQVTTEEQLGWEEERRGWRDLGQPPHSWALKARRGRPLPGPWDSAIFAGCRLGRGAELGAQSCCVSQSSPEALLGWPGAVGQALAWQVFRQDHYPFLAGCTARSSQVAKVETAYQQKGLNCKCVHENRQQALKD